MKSILTAAALVVLFPAAVAAERAQSPADATVFIRLVGSIHADIDEAGLKRTFDQDRVEIGTGSGFVISPFGYVITNDHVISNSELLLTNGIRKAKVTIKVSRIDVCFPPTVQGSHSMTSGCTQAAVQSSDPTVDLAVLFINGSNLPYVAFGDSDIVRPGQPVDALGYPYGKELEVGRETSAVDIVPEVSTT